MDRTATKSSNDILVAEIAPSLSFATDPQIETDVKRLGSLPIAELRTIWRERFKSDPPQAFGPDLLRRALAQHLQEKAFGGLNPAARRDLERAICMLNRKQSGRIEVARRIKAGSVLTREWKGASHRVTVLDRGFNYDGETYASLSEIARKITGTRWNGPRFFGLRASAPSTSESSNRLGDAEIVGKRHRGRSKKSIQCTEANYGH